MKTAVTTMRSRLPASLSFGFLLAFFFLEVSHTHVLRVASEPVVAVAIKAPIVSNEEICSSCLGLRKLLPPSPPPPPPPRQGVEEEGGIDDQRAGQTCSRDAIDIYQGQTDPLPNGIPTYTVQIVNLCVTGCAVADIHLSCGWFSTARLINPNLFRRLSYNDCLVNNGEPLAHGQSLSFVYANSFDYPLAVSSLTCL